LFTTVVVMAMLLASAAMAGEMHYKFYGKAHVSTESLNNGDESSIFMSSNSTRVGIKGKYATDVEWLNVVFQYESKADFNGESSNVFSSRNSFAGVHGENWGRIVWGRHDTPFKTIGRKVDLFADRIGDNRNFTAVYDWDRRVANMVMYNSPWFGDAFGVNLQYVPEEGVDNATLFSGSAIYKAERFMVAAAFENHGKAWEMAYNPSQPDSSESSTAFRVSAAYTGEAFKAVGLFQSVSNAGGMDGVSSTTWGLGASWRPSAWEPKAQYYMFDPNTDADDDAASMLAIGVDYHLNKNALLYLMYAATMNDDGAAFAPFYGGHGQDFPYATGDPNVPFLPAKPGETAYGIALGLIAKW
jgi:predicted porin